LDRFSCYLVERIMTRREQAALPGLMAFLVVLLTLLAVMAIMFGAQHQDELDRRAMEQAQKCQPAQESPEARLNAMVGYDEIKQKGE